MAWVDAVWQPPYAVKSAVKLLLFSLLPVSYGLWNREMQLKNLFRFRKNGFFIALLCGIALFCIILGGYFLLGSFFDLSGITRSLSGNIGVNAGNFGFVALYIAVVNAFLEEFFFRGFSFLALKEITSRRFACLFSAFCFSLYHVAMMIGWFELPLFLLTVLALFAAGLILNRFNEQFENIYGSYLIHMFANLAINTIGFLLFQTS